MAHEQRSDEARGFENTAYQTLTMNPYVIAGELPGGADLGDHRAIPNADHDFIGNPRPGRHELPARIDEIAEWSKVMTQKVTTLRPRRFLSFGACWIMAGFESNPRCRNRDSSCAA